MRVQQLEQMYREGMHRLKEQMKKQERASRKREMRLVEEELNRILEQAVSLKGHIEDILNQREE